MRGFAEYFVGVIFFDKLRADKSALRGKQLNLLKNACEVIYVDATAQEWQNQKTGALSDETSETEEEA